MLDIKKSDEVKILLLELCLDDLTLLIVFFVFHFRFRGRV